jgi:hypothetical protein
LIISIPLTPAPRSSRHHGRFGARRRGYRARVTERSPDEVDADIDAERTVTDDQVEMDGVAEPIASDPDREVEIDDEGELEQPDLGDFEGNLNA